MCSIVDRFLGTCGYMPPTTRFAIMSVLAAFLLATALRLRN
jgi:hypothetical protein